MPEPADRLRTGLYLSVVRVLGRGIGLAAGDGDGNHRNRRMAITQIG
jgi:hypothetical protein